MRHVTILVLAALLLPASSLARTWHISPDGTGDAPTIQTAVDSSSLDDVIELACGTYLEHSVVLKSGITLQTTSGEPDCAAIDAQQQGRVFYLDDCSEVVLQGLTLTGGNPPGDHGGAIIAYSSSLTLAACVLTGNATIHEGGAIAVNGTSATFIDCIFFGNLSQGSSGGAVNGYNSTLDFQGCTITGNVTAGVGGGVVCQGTTTATLTQSILWGNSAGAGHELSIGTDASAAFNCSVADTTAGWLSGPSMVTFGPLTVFSNPKFCGPLSSDYHLRTNSPCAPANSNGCGLIGALPVACGPVAVQAIGWGKIKGAYR